MISASVQETATLFKERWHSYLKVSPSLVLDDSYLSLGVLDLLTFSLRLNRELSPQLDSVLKGVAAYLSVIVHNTWLAVTSDVEVVNGDDGICIEARGGEYINEGEDVQLYIEKDVRNLIAELPHRIPILHGFSRSIIFSSNIFSLFGCGMVMGLYPSIRGTWEFRDPQKHDECSGLLIKSLAKQAADSYKRIFPNEPLGQNEELYLCDLIYPPFFMDEPYPGVRSVTKLCEFFKDNKVTKEQILSLGYNLSFSPDEILSCIGLVLYSACVDSSLPPEIISCAEVKSDFMGLLRGAMIYVRETLELGDDWIIEGIRSEKDEIRFLVEADLGFIPWLYLDEARIKKDVKEGSLKEFLIALANFDDKEAIQKCNSLLENDPGDISLRIQRIRLEMLNKDFQKSADLCQALLSEPDSDKNPRFFNLWGLCMLQLGDIDKAARYFKAAIAASSSLTCIHSDLENNLAWSLMLKGEYESALVHIEEGLCCARNPVTLLLNKCHILYSLGRTEELDSIRKRLFALAPCDRRVFANIAFVKV